MSKLYIANPKTQAETFSYRVPDERVDPSRPSHGVSLSGVRTQDIPPGGYITLSGDLSTGQIDAIIDQHQKYGLYRIEDVSRRQPDYVSLLCTIDKPPSLSILEGVMRRNIELLHIRGREMRKLAAVSVNNRIETDMQESRMPGQLTKLEMEIVEQRTVSSDTPETEAQRVRVTRDTEGPESATRQKRAYTRRAA